MNKTTLITPVVASAVILAGLGFAPTVAEASINWNTDGTASVANPGDIDSVGKYIGVTTSVDYANHKVKWVVTFNKAEERWWFGQILHVFLPADVDSKSVVIERVYGSGSDWTAQSTIKNETSAAGNSRYDKDPTSPEWLDDWNGRFYERAEAQPVNPEDLAELQGWYNSGKFGAHFYSQEGAGSSKFVWTITADFKEGSDPYSMPLVFVEGRPGGNAYALLQGPHNTDKYNFNDVAENAWGIDPTVVDTITQYVTPSLHADEKVNVENPSNLTDADKQALIAAAKQAVRNGINESSRRELKPDTILNESTFVLKDNGTIVVTYPDNSKEVASTDILDISDLIARVDKSEAPGVNPVHSHAKVVSGTGIKGSKITVALPDGSVLNTLVQEDGTWSVDLPKTLAAGQTISVRQFEDGRAPSVPVEQAIINSIADSNPVNPPATKVYVDDATHLSAAEKAAVEQAVRAANPTDPNKSANLEVKDDGTVVLTYSDGSTNEVKPETTIQQKEQAAAPVLSDVHPGDTALSGTGRPGSTIKVKIGSGEPKETTVAPDGSWKLEGISPALKPGDKLSVTQVSDSTLPNTIETVVKAAAPADKIKVDDASHLSDAEKNAVKDAIKNANTDFPADTKISVDDDGTAHIVYPGGTNETIPSDSLISQRPASQAPTIDRLDSDDTNITGTAKPDASVEVTLPDGSKLTGTANAEGKWSISLPANKDLSQGDSVTVSARDDADHAPATATTTVEKTDADKANESGVTKPADKIAVDNATKLTDNEKQKVKDALTDANAGLQPAIDHVDVADDGTAKLVFPDGSVIEIPGSDLISQKPASQVPTIDRLDSDDANITGTAKPGASVEVTLPDGSKLTGTANAEGKWSVALPADKDLSHGDSVSVVVRDDADHAPATATTTVEKTDADKANESGVNKPADKISVDDATKLTDEEKQQVKDAVTDANAGLQPAIDHVDVADDGTATLVFPDGSTIEIAGSDLISQKDPSTAPTVDPVSSVSAEVSGTGVAGSEIVVTLPDGTKLTTTVGDDGNWKVELPSALKADDTLTVSQREPGKAPATQAVTVESSQAESTEVNRPGSKVEVNDPNNLTDEEKDKVKGAIKDANPDLPEGTEIEAGDNGVTITFPDGSTKEIPYSDLVVKEGATDNGGTNNGGVNNGDADKNGSGKNVNAKPATGHGVLANTGDPATGVAAATGIAGVFASMAAALLRKRRD